MKSLLILITISPILLMMPSFGQNIPTSKRADKAISKTEPSLIAELNEKGLEYGAPIFIRIFKSTSELELWVQGQTAFELFKTYKICTFSGTLGPKTREGDRQAPEGFYFVTPNALNPRSAYHLSFNLGYPNSYDRHHGYTGSALMVHGKCVSIGCYAMTDKNINEIYTLAHAAFKNGQPFFRVHAFPFRFDGNKLDHYSEHKWYRFWLNLKQGYDLFNEKKRPPNTVLENGRYHFE